MSGPPAPRLALALFLVLYATQRLLELRLSSRHARILLARGGVEYGRGHFPLFVVIHALFPCALVAEVLLSRTRPPALWPLWLGVCLVASALRLASMRALGELWTARIIVMPGVAPVRRGIYRWFAHPSYLAATLELAAVPLAFGAPVTACIFTTLSGLALAFRIPRERRALAAQASLSVR